MTDPSYIVHTFCDETNNTQGINRGIIPMNPINSFVMRGIEMSNTSKGPSPYEPRKPVLPKPVNVRSNNSSPYDASGRPKS